jgi:hypothetical protein
MSMVPEAHFDCLLILSELDAPLSGVTRLELQRIAFLACLLSIYTAQPVAEWGYKFANTGAGLPFSDHLSEAIESMLASSRLAVDDAGRLTVTAQGRAILERLGTLQNLVSRVPCVTSAAASLLAVPSAVMTDGLEQEPTTAASQLRDGPTMLLDEPHLLTLYGHFEALAKFHPPGSCDLLSPSVLWLSYMAAEKAADDAKRDAEQAAAQVELDGEAA